MAMDIQINKFTLKDIRCFESEHEFNIRPITFLIGENSTGKTTTLGCLSALRKYITREPFRDESEINFNSAPYEMGSFNDIVRKSKPLKKEFQLGLEYYVHDKSNIKKTVKFLITLIAGNKESVAMIKKIEWIFVEHNKTFSIEYVEHDSDTTEKKSFGRFVNESKLEIENNTARFLVPRTIEAYFFFLLPDRFEMLLGKETKKNKNLGKLNNWFKEINIDIEELLFRTTHFNRNKVSSFGPVRTKPKRTYDQIMTDTPTPGGTETPIILKNFSKNEWERLKESLSKFNKDSGLFSDITVRELGKSSSDPFQIQVSIRGYKANLMDVGYGVSQILPILVRILTEKRSSQFLLQQPEVHLHPRAQAELTSLLVSTLKENSTPKEESNSYIIETHSDYMIDRARIEIRKGRIKPEDVSLIFLESYKRGVRVHNISFDKQANMVDVPRSYRNFFQKELNSLLGFDD